MFKECLALLVDGVYYGSSMKLSYFLKMDM